MAHITRPATALALTLSLAAAMAAQKDCNRTSTGLVPLLDMGTGTYKSYPGRLYPGGNTVPASHAAGGNAAVAAIQPLDGTGQPSPTGRIVLVSIGMSNTTQEFSEFVRRSDADPQRKPAVRVVDLAQGGMDAPKVADPNHQFWTVAAARLANAGVTAQQVQVAWIKEAIARPTKAFPNNALELRDLLGQICRNLKAKYPNIRIAFVSSRIYAGYALGNLNPEPFAYEGGFAVRWLIEQQMQGQGNLNHDPAKGPVVAPWLAWGPYLWADGLKPRSDGLTWACDDFAADGTHPATSGRQKVAGMLLGHFANDPFSKPWYGGSTGGGTPASVTPYGAGCAGSTGTPGLRTNSQPSLGNNDFAIGITGIPARAPALFFLSAASANLPVQGCTLLVDPAQVFFAATLAASTGGTAVLRFQIPNDTALLGATAYAQWFDQDSASPNLALIGGGAATPGAKLVVGR